MPGPFHARRRRGLTLLAGARRRIQKLVDIAINAIALRAHQKPTSGGAAWASNEVAREITASAPKAAPNQSAETPLNYSEQFGSILVCQLVRRIWNNHKCADRFCVSAIKVG